MIDFISLHLILSKSDGDLCNHPENKDNTFPRDPPFHSLFLLCASNFNILFDEIPRFNQIFSLHT